MQSEFSSLPEFMYRSGPLRLGIDGGGSGSRFVLYAPAAARYHSFQGPSLQVREQSPEELAGRLLSTLAEVLPPARWQQLESISAGLAGFSSGQDAITLPLRKHVPQAHLLLLSDAEACFAAHYPDAESAEGGAMMMCGTGSVLVYESEGRLQYAGGYGPAAFEACAGRQIGRDFLSLLASLYEKKQIPPDFEAFGCAPRERRGLLRLLYDTPGTPACFAPACIALAEAGNPGCRAIVAAHVEAVCGLVAAGREAGSPLRQTGLYGGLIKASFLRKQLANRLQKSFNDMYIYEAGGNVARFLSKQTPGSCRFLRHL